MTEPPPLDESTPTGKPRRRTRARKVIYVVLGMLLLAVLVTGGYLFNLAHTFNTSAQTIEGAFPEESTRPSEESTLPAGEPESGEGQGSTVHSGEEVNILLLGSDSGPQDGQPAEPGPTGRRSDAIMLVHIPSDREDIYVMSIMRDLWTAIPEYGQQKINAAFSFGGIPLTVQTVERLFDERIDHVVAVDFAGFKSLTDALGGVTVGVPATFTTTGSEPETFTQGEVTLDGESALRFVRERKAFSTGGFQRVVNQQIFVKAVLDQFLSSDTLANPARIQDVVADFSPYIRVDEGFDAGTVASLAWSLRGLESDDVELFTLPTNGLGTSAGGASIVLKDPAAIDALSRAFDQGTVDHFLESRGLAEGTNHPGQDNHHPGQNN